MSDPEQEVQTPDREERLAAEDLAVLREALDGLRDEIRTRFGAPDAGFDWMALYESLRQRFQSLGMRPRAEEVDEFGMDAGALESALPLLDLLFERWWRIEVAGLGDLPELGPCLFVANRAGLLPWDGLMIAHAVSRRRPAWPRPRYLVADWLVTLPFAQPWITRLGGVRACRENAERLLRGGHPVVAFPEGQKGAAKVFRNRYRLQRFGRGGVVRTALAAGVPLVPVAVVGAEEVHPVLFKVETAARAVGLPFLPVTPTFPALGPLGFVPLPSKWWIGFGAPIETRALGPDAADDELLVWRMTEEIRASIQDMVDAGLETRDSIWR
ncbi:MAG: lysophospholipid acyltransferase family protein [Myxococcota bacterium]|nr:lysophospholipid acyltransferase family protein [Myxococcota bacterium]